LGVIGKTAVENKVFSESYQRKSGLEAERVRYTAELAKINSLLLSETDRNTIKDLKSKKALLEVLLDANRMK
jgi:hypothetical protein